MSMRKVALLAAIVAVPACSKSDKDDGGSSNKPETPGLNTVAPANFRNTATSAREVGDRVGQVEQGMSQGSLALRQQSNDQKKESSRRLSELTTSFLAGKGLNHGRGEIIVDEDAPQSGFNLAEGADCSSIAQSIEGTYATTLKGLKASADALVTFDQKLPEYITKLPANERFAVSYQIDLSRIAEPAQASQQPGTVAAPKISGNALISAGANDHAVGIESSMDVTMQLEASAQNPGIQGRIQAGVAAYADAATQTVKFKSNVVAGGVAVDPESGERRATNVAATFGMGVIGGALPAISFDGSASGNLGVDEQGRPKNANILAQFTMTKRSDSEISLKLHATVDGKPQSAEVILAANKFGRCVVKSQHVK